MGRDHGLLSGKLPSKLRVAAESRTRNTRARSGPPVTRGTGWGPRSDVQSIPRQAALPRRIDGLALAAPLRLSDRTRHIMFSCLPVRGCLLSPAAGRLRGCRSVGAKANRDELVAQELLAKDIGVAAMLRQLAEYVEIYPAQRKGATPVALDDVVQGQMRGRSS